MKFTDRYIHGLQPEAKKYYVREGHGFTIQVLPSGVKTFMFIYTLEGKRKYFNLGNYPATSLDQARAKYIEVQDLVNKGQDPSEPVVLEAAKSEESNANETFGHFCSLYLDSVEKQYSPSWYSTVRLSLFNDVLPYFKDTPINAIRRRDAIAMLERVGKRSPGMVANVQKACRAVFDYALQREYIDYNPFLSLTKVVPELKYNPRDRVLNEDEIRHVWKAIDEGTGDAATKRALKLVLVTAQRPVEVAGLAFSEVRGDTWCIPAARAEKGKRDHCVYLTATARELLQEPPEGSKEVYAFPSPKKSSAAPTRPIQRNSLSQIVSKNLYYNIPRWTPHDLRRTARTFMAKIGIPDEIAEVVINHAKRGIIGVYNKYEYAKEKQHALEAWENELKRILRT